MAYKFYEGGQASISGLTPGLSKVQPIYDHSGFVFYSEGEKDIPILDYLNRNVFDGKYPTPTYEMLNNQVMILSDALALEGHPILDQVEADQIVTLIVNAGQHEISVSNEHAFPSVIKIGEQAKEVILQILTLSNTKEVSYGLDDLLGYGYYGKLDELSREGILKMENINELTGYLSLFASWNSFSSCAQYVLDLVESKGLLFSSLDEMIQKIFNEVDLKSLCGSIKGIVLNKQKTDSLQFLEKGHAALKEMESLFGSVSASLPSLDFLFEMFWSQFNKNLQLHQQTFAFLQRFAKAKNEFDVAMTLSAGQSIHNELMGPKGEKMLGDASKHAELLIGGGLFGVIPFLIGTIYQIIYDIINLVVNLCWYAFWAASGIVQWLITPKPDVEEEMIAADKSLLDLFTYGFDIEMNEVPGMVYDIASEIGSMLKSAIDSFIDHAEEYGRVAGEMLGSAVITVSSGALSLITSGYPEKPTLWNRFLYIIKQWFNIGCLLGPIVVDIILLFCSGGVSGIFSGAAKLGKLDKVGDLFRFFSKTKTLIESMTFFKKMDTIMPPGLLATGQKLLAQLRSITLSFRHQIEVIVHAAAETLERAGATVDRMEIAKVAEKLDSLYNITSVIDLLAALVFFLVGGKEANVNVEGKVIPA